MFLGAKTRIPLLLPGSEPSWVKFRLSKIANQSVVLVSAVLSSDIHRLVEGGIGREQRTSSLGTAR